jgi:hypothetical protein
MQQQRLNFFSVAFGTTNDELPRLVASKTAPAPAPPPPPPHPRPPPVAKDVDSGRYVCNQCLSTFHTKTGLSKHNTQACTILLQARRKRNAFNDALADPTPSNEDLYAAFKVMVTKVDLLEKELQQVRKQVARKLTDLECLQKSYFPSILFDDWLQSLVVEEKHLDVVFDGDGSVISGCNMLLVDSYNRLGGSTFPIASFAKKQHMYFYTKKPPPPQAAATAVTKAPQAPAPAPAPAAQTKCWRIMSEADIDSFFEAICQRFLLAFLIWKDEHGRCQTKMGNKKTSESFEELTLGYYKKFNPSDSLLRKLRFAVRHQLSEYFENIYFN